MPKPDAPRPSSREHRHPGGWRVSPAPDGRGTPEPGKSGRRAHPGWWLVLLVVVALDFAFLTTVGSDRTQRIRVPYAPVFLEQVQAGNVKAVSSKGESVEGTFRSAVKDPAGGDASKTFRTQVPSYADGAALEALLQEQRVEINAREVDQGPSLGSILISLLPMLLIVGLIIVMMRRSSAGVGLMGFGRSRAHRVEPGEQRVAFRDVAGVDEAKAELDQIVDVLRNPARYRRLGARTPRGVLLVGPPGTGKTLLARAVAGEAHVPFFWIAASEFIELYVGVGASRVRDLFAQAKAAAPAIVFIDELDAIGRARGPGSMSGGHEEREQTLNQILAEMDGFDPSIGVIVLSATNRPEVLDKALLRPGRFDRRVALEPPDQRGRRAILDVHVRAIPLADDVDLDQVASITPGMVGADLANLVNEAALIAARREAPAVTAADLSAALDRLVLGSERRILMSPEDRRRTAYHEGGHALAGILTPGADPVRKVSIIPHGKTLGVTLAAPAADRFSYDAVYLRAKLDVLQAGQAAEALACDGDVSTGAENDLREATELARHMVGSWGMSEALGPMTLVHDPDQAIAFPASTETSEETRSLLDHEVRRLLRESRGRAEALLERHRDALDRLAEALLADETLDAADAYAAAGATPLPAEGRDAAQVGSSAVPEGAA